MINNIFMGFLILLSASLMVVILYQAGQEEALHKYIDLQHSDAMTDVMHLNRCRNTLDLYNIGRN